MSQGRLRRRAKFCLPAEAHCASLKRRGIAADAENLAQEPRSAFAPASYEIAPLQIQIDKIQAPSRKRVFQQYPPFLAIERAYAH